MSSDSWEQAYVAAQIAREKLRRRLLEAESKQEVLEPGDFPSTED